MIKRFAAIVALALAACGNPVADGSYKGQPLVTLHGTIGQAGSSVVPTNPSVALIWNTSLDGGQVSTPFGSQEIPSLVGELAPVSAVSFPASFDFQIFNPPPAAAMFPLDGGQIAGAYIAAIDDVNGDGTFTLTNTTVTYSCFSDGGCTKPSGSNWITVLDTSESGDSTTGITQVSLVVVEVAPPDQLLGVSPDFLLLYDTGWNGSLASELSEVGDSAALAQSGYHLLNECQVPVIGCTASDCAQSFPQIVADTAAIDIGPGGQQGSDATLPMCSSDSVCGAGFACPAGCMPTPPAGASTVCTCVPESPNISSELQATCVTDADCCTGICIPVEGGQGLCSSVGGFGAGAAGAATTSGSGGAVAGATSGTSGAATASTTGGASGTAGSGATAGGTSGGSSGTTGSNPCNGNACNTVVNAGLVVQLEQVAGPSPTPLGGGLPPPGTYVLTAAQIFTGDGGATGPTGDTYQETWVIGSNMGGGQESAEGVLDDFGCPMTLSGAATVSGTWLTFDFVCGPLGGEMVGYTLTQGATTTLELVGAPVLTYTLQP